MKKNMTYREKLLELARIYRISEINNYAKNKKTLTILQLELLLKKNKVTIPKEVNKNLIQIQAKKISTPIFSFGKNVRNFLESIISNTIKIIFLFKKTLINIAYFFKTGINNFLNFISKTTIELLNNFYNFKVEEKKANKVVAQISLVVLILAVSLTGFSFYSKKQNIFEITKPLFKVEKKQETVKKLEKKKPQEKKPNEVAELVLPNLNLKTETVLSLFEDVNYDLRKVRFEKRVKPIYFTQFPKDLDEIQSIKLKKETFIKIVLPLVVAENGKILNDRLKLMKIKSKRITSDKEKLWLRQKFREYKILKSDMKELEKRMDIIPVSIALSQAAKESGWGTSRFALEGNAIFGQWTWSGKGIEPLSREAGKNHKILRFPILRASVKAYKNNLNTHKGYKKFREKRYFLRKKNNSVKGLELIHTLDTYAQTGTEYTKTLEEIINQNRLNEFETVRLTNEIDRKELDL